MKAHVAGIAMGLIKDGNKFAVLTDILGDEDHLGDMDFKVAGTTAGITALQMDIKIQGITKEIMQVALAQASEARLHILGKMQEAMPHTKTELSDFAPRLITIKINPEKIRDVIGKGGATIRALTEETKTQIDINDEGIVTIASVDAAAGQVARKRIEDLTAEVRGRHGLRGHGAQAARLRRDRPGPAGQGRPAAHQPDRQRARECGDGLSEGRPGREGQGPRGRRQGAPAPVDEGGRRGCAGTAGGRGRVVRGRRRERRASARFFFWGSGRASTPTHRPRADAGTGRVVPPRVIAALMMAPQPTITHRGSAP